MKCDELKVIEFYPRNDVDNIIGCLKADRAQAEENAAFWKKKAEDVKAENRELKRSLWLAKANRAKAVIDDVDNVITLCKIFKPFEELNELVYKKMSVWKKVYSLCRAKEKEYE